MTDYSDAIREAQRRIEALGTEWTHTRAGVTTLEPASAADFKREALAALAALEPPSPTEKEQP